MGRKRRNCQKQFQAIIRQKTKKKWHGPLLFVTAIVPVETREELLSDQSEVGLLEVAGVPGNLKPTVILHSLLRLGKILDYF